MTKYSGQQGKQAGNFARSPSILDRARSYVSRIPGAVSGNAGHDQTFVVACALANGFALSEADALSLLREYNATCSPPWSERELIHKIQSAMNTAHSKPRGYLLGPGQRFDRIVPRPSVSVPKPKLDPATAVENYLKGFRGEEADVWEASPVRPPDDWTQDPVALLECLYRPGERINFVTAFKETSGKANPIGNGETVERDTLIDRWRKSGMPTSAAGGWLRMNPLDGQGIADLNVTSYRFALIECDSVPVDLQLSLLVRLPLPIALILTSGGRSLHAWVKVDAGSVEEYRQTVIKMLALLEKFGVDGKNRNPSRLSRLPGVVRSIGATGDGRQRILYLNPDPIQRRIL